MFPENAFYPHLSFFNYQFSIIGFPLKFIPDFSEINSNSNPVFIHSGDHTGTPLRQSIINSQLMDSRLRGNDISCLQRCFILSFLSLTESCPHYPYLLIRSRYILIFEENYGRFVALSILLTPNFNALLNPI